MNQDKFIEECKKINIEITDEILSKLIRYKDLLIKWNKKFNLTTIVLDEDIFLKHFYDSLCITKAIQFNNQKLCDFGTGAGFPGMVLAIVFNDLDVTLMESNNKKITFLEAVKDELNLNNVSIICSRTEDYGKINRDIFDIVTCRAVSNLNIILELASPILKVNGLFIPMKSNIDEEFENAKKNIDKLSFKLLNVIEYFLPLENSKRTILVFNKIRKTEIKYPRNYNIIKKESIMK